MVQLLDTDIKTKEVLDWKGVHLLHFQHSSCSQKTRIFLNLKGIDWTSHHVNLAKQENYEPWFLGINPRGLVPVLVHDGVVHIESNDILTYLDEHFGDRRLIPEHAQNEIASGLAEEDNLHLDIRTITMRFIAPRRLANKQPEKLNAYELDDGTIEGQADSHKALELKFWKDFNQRGIPDAAAQTSVMRFHAVYARFEDILARQPYLAGEMVTLLDVAWFIYTHRLTQAGYPFEEAHPNVAAWFVALSKMDAFAKEVQAPMPMRIGLGLLQGLRRISGSTLQQVVKVPKVAA
ncbi:MAG: glutathione S-transferase family protein [Pseudomonadota bacterium]